MANQFEVIDKTENIDNIFNEIYMASETFDDIYKDNKDTIKSDNIKSDNS